MLVCTGQVLTCAHVIGKDAGTAVSDSTVFVEFVSLPGTPTASARVAEGGWVPIRADESGDIALLDFDGAPPTRVMPSPLRRLLGRGRSVHAFGFPEGAEQYGVNATAVLSGPGGPGGEWIQLDSPSDDRRVTGGFSGAGVVDQHTHAVIGMVVMEYVREQPAVSWMIPIETILRHLPGLAGCVAGPTAVDKELVTIERLPPADDGFARKVARWFRRAGAPVRLVVTGEPGSSASSGLRSMIVLADRELRPPSVVRSADGTVPPVGSVDLAVDASGKSVDTLSARISDRIGPSIDARRGVPAALVVDGVDDAADPEALLRELLKPLADHGMRLLLGFRRDSSPAWGLARSLWPGGDTPDDHPDVVRDRLVELAARIVHIADREGELLPYRDHVARRISGAPELPVRTFELRALLAAARAAPHDTERLDEADEAAERAAHRLDEFGRRLDALLERRRELRGRLEAYHAMAVDRGLTENVHLDPFYRQAYEALRRRPCDLVEGARLVDDYRTAIRRLGER